MQANVKDKISIIGYIVLFIITFIVFCFCVCSGSVNVTFKDTIESVLNTLLARPVTTGIYHSIIINVRIPRVLCVGLEGAALSICGVAMQGLLRNPLADGQTIGVSSGASLGAILSIAFGITIPGFPLGGTIGMAMFFAFCSLLIILSLAYKLDYSLSTNTIILIGVIFSMFISSVNSLIITFAGNKVKSIMFWSMGSLSGSNYTHVIILSVCLAIFGTIIFSHSRELNAFAISENNARHIGVNVKRVKLIILISVAAIIGVCVSIGGTIGFVGLVIPHMTRMLVGPNHKRLLPATLFSGAMFLMLADLMSRTLLKPLELPIGVITSFVGSIVFIYIFYISRKVK